MFDLDNPLVVRGLLRELADAVCDAQARAAEAEARADHIAATALRLLEIVERRLSEAADRVASIEAASAEERRGLEERLSEAERRACRAETQADAAGEVLARLRDVLDQTVHADANGAGLSRQSLH